MGGREKSNDERFLCIGDEKLSFVDTATDFYLERIGNGKMEQLSEKEDPDRKKGVKIWTAN